MNSYDAIPGDESQRVVKKEFRDRVVLVGLLCCAGTLAALNFFGVNFWGVHFPIIQRLDFKELKGTKPMFEIPSTDELIFSLGDEISFVATNEYGQYSGSYPWLDDVPGSQIVEPYKKTTLTASGRLVSKGSSVFFWEIEGKSDTYNGTSLTTKFKDTKVRTATVHAFDSEGDYQISYSTLLISRYVKREIRSLTQGDRDRFLDAAHVLWEYSTEDGRVIYGDKFTSIQSFVEEHSIASNDIMCDGFHEGTGFLTRHFALTNSFEAAVRAVDPSVTLPYWDFTIEGEEIHELGKQPSYLMDISPVFTADWFGTVGDDHHIQDGRWAHSEMPIASSDSVAQNSYGFVRAFWNNNPDYEVQRYPFYDCGMTAKHKLIPRCDTHYTILESANLGDFLLLSPADGHGPMHVNVGGIWGGCEQAYTNFTSKWGEILDHNLTIDEVAAMGYDTNLFFNKWGYTAQRRLMFETAIMGEYFHIYRSFWRSHVCAVDNSYALLECPDECDPDKTPFEECACSVPKLVSGETSWQNMYPCLLNSESNQLVFNATMPDEMLKDLVYMIATSSVLEGEMIESASTADITFWLIHPVIERLLAAKRLTTVTKMGDTEFSKWNVVDGSNETWLAYSYYNLEEGQNLFHPDAYTCAGHTADDTALPDTMPYTSAIDDNADLNGDGVISNWEFYLALNPNDRDANDYVFDNFDWDHCAYVQALGS